MLSSYRQVKDLGTLGTLYAGAAFEAGNVFAATDHPSFSDLIYSGTLFAALSTGNYPVYLGYGLAEGGHSGMYLVVGRIFFIGRHRPMVAKSSPAPRFTKLEEPLRS
jgi:hypothetical protein